MKQNYQLKLFIAPSESTTTEFRVISNPLLINEDKIIPIHLYVKEFSITKLLYFGMTTKKDPVTYPGSGLYWANHYKKHGGKKFIKTLCVWTFNNQNDATEFALRFSEDNNIVESEKWANLIPENAIHREVSSETRKKKRDTYHDKSPEEKAAIIQKRLETLNNKSPEEKAANKQRELETKNNKSSEEKAEIAQKISDSKRNRSPEEKAEIAQKKRDAWQNRSPEEKDASIQKILDTQNNKSPEEKAEIAQKLSAIHQNRSPEEKAEYAQKQRDANKGLRLYDKQGEKSRKFKKQPEDLTWIPRNASGKTKLDLDKEIPLYDHPSKQSKRFQYPPKDPTWVLRVSK